MVLKLLQNLRFSPTEIYPAGTYEDPPEILVKEFKLSPGLFMDITPKKSKPKKTTDNKPADDKKAKK